MNSKQFVHLHVHSHYSIMNGCNTVPQLVDRAIRNRMKGMALTDTGNMYGIMEFFDYVSKVNSERESKKQKPFKPILGCEMYVAKHGKKAQKEGTKDQKGYHVTILAKNLTGYRNLVKLVSNAWTDGFYGSPRTDRTDLKKYHEGLILLSGGAGSEVFAHAMKENMTALEETIRWYRETFADDFYIELQRYTHQGVTNDAAYKLTNKQAKVDQILLQKAKELGVNVVATNDVRFISKAYAEAYEYQNRIALGDYMPQIWQDAENQKWLKSRSEMNELFVDIPQAIESTIEILEKVELYDIRHAPVFPKTSQDNVRQTQGNSEDDNLCELVYEKAKQIYGSPLLEDVDNRLSFELDVIKEKRASGYFLFVHEVVSVATEQLGVLVGPGRGSTAGSLVSYCLGITKIDPLKHDLLFERFLCPGTSTMPDIDLDLDEEGRTRIIEWLEEKYGKDCCAHIITFTHMSARKSVLLLGEVEGWLNNFSKSICHLFLDGGITNLSQWTLAVKKQLRSKADVRRVLRIAKMLEGTIYNTGIHTCGYVVSNNPVDDYAPTSQMEAPDWHRGVSRCVEYDGNHVETTGLVKLDFLYFDTLTQQKEICERIKTTQGIDINLDLIPIDDTKTFELFQNGETEGIFFFETEGMRKYLRKLRPTQFEDLVLLNALCRPGVMTKIPKLIAHKTGKKEIRYAIPCMEKYLYDTYGILAYQEQLMLLSRLIADFSREESDKLRKALGNKKLADMAELKARFMAGGLKNGHEKSVLRKIWIEWEKSGTYLFNKAHAVCYTWIAYQMAYLKAYYPTEFSEVMSSK
ncbi:MAG: DNA polymerase III subunit alpha [Prevotella sp.]|nr:DNA polymerase III subunit alpha [Prevotella sp.]